MTVTPNLALPYLAAAQAQKHVTHNEALRRLDALVMLAITDRDLSLPPASPVDGARYIVAAGPSGAWAGQAGAIAAWQDGAWAFLAPRPGFLAYVADEAALLVWDGAAWQPVGSGPLSELHNLTRLGVGTAADATNPFAAKLNNALWVARTAAEGGDGTLRYKMSKETAAATLSLLMQTAYSGRAEIGLAGDDDLHVKVSPDGATWFEAIRVERASGRLSFPASGGPREMLAANRTYYVRGDGSDANDGRTNVAGGAFLTIQKAVDTAAMLDLSLYAVTIQVAAGTYTGAVALKSYVGVGPVTIQGDPTTPANVVVSTTGATAFTGDGVIGKYVLKGFKTVTTTTGYHLSVTNGSVVDLANWEFGAAASGYVHCRVAGGASLNVTGSYTVSGGAYDHWLVYDQAFLFAGVVTVTITGSPAFTNWARATRGGGMFVADITYSGAPAAGVKKYDVQLTAFVVFGGNTLPGSVAGTTATGGQVG